MRRERLLSLCVVALAATLAGCGGRKLRCDDVVSWRQDYAEIGPGIREGTPAAPDQPDKTKLIGTLVCPPPSGYQYDTDLQVFNIYWPADPPPEEITIATRDPERDPTAINISRAPDPPRPGGGGGKPVEVRPTHETKPPGTAPRTEIPLPDGAAPPRARVVVEPVTTRVEGIFRPVVFEDPAIKLAEVQRPDYTQRMIREAIALEPALNVRGTQVHMGYWSGGGRLNEEALLSLLSRINTPPPGGGRPTDVAMYDGGLTITRPFPSYVEMTRAAWYPRSNAPGGRFSMPDGSTFVDPHRVTFPQANEIWGQFSARYAQMAIDLATITGKPIEVWCFVEGAAADRIFHQYELPVLRDLKALGVIGKINYAKTRGADWTKPADWQDTPQVPTPGRTGAPPPTPVAPPTPPPTPPPAPPTPPAPPP